MKDTEPSTMQLKGSARRIVEDERNNEEMEGLRQENMRLGGEITILRQNMVALEKQNFALKEQRSRAMVSDLKTADMLRKEVNVLRVENRIRENRCRAFKRPRTEAGIDIRWALSRSGSSISFSLFPFELDRLRFLKDFFYPDFCQFDSKEVIREMYGVTSRFREFVDFYMLFSCKVDVFKEFFHTVFMDPGVSEEKIELFSSVPLDWLLNLGSKDSMRLIKEFIQTNYRELGQFFLRIVRERPFLLNIFVSKEMFGRLARTESRMSREFVSEVCRGGGMDLVDHTNIHYIPQADLQAMYREFYFEIPQSP